MTSPFESLSGIQTLSGLLLLSPWNLFFPNFLNLVKRMPHRTKPGVTAQCSCSTVHPKTNQGPSTYLWNTTRIHAISLQFSSQFLLLHQISYQFIYKFLSEDSDQIQSRLVAFHVCGGTASILEFLLHYFDGCLLLLPVEVHDYLCPFTFTYLVLVEASCSSFLRKLFCSVCRT